VEGVAQLSEGASSLAEALGELDKAGSKLNKGFSGGVKATKKLAKAMRKFDKEGIQELKGQDVEELSLRLRAVQQAGKDFRSFSGLEPGRKGSVRFVIETEEIREEK
jgi:putative membrane protein